MKNKKGFTLVELLAVIVILAVLVLLAVPSVIKMLDNTRKNAFKVEAENIIKAGKNAYSNNALNGITKKCYTLEELSDYVDKNFTGYSGSVYIDSETNTYKVWLSKEPYIINGSNTGNISVIELEQFNNASTTCQDITVLACTNYKYFASVQAYGGEFENGDTFRSYEMLPGEIQEIEIPTKDGFVFDEWFVAGSPASFENDILTMGTENAVITAQWTPNTYTITYNCNGGEGTMADSIHTYDSPSPLAASKCYKIGETSISAVIGWAKTPTATLVEYTLGEKVTSVTTGSAQTLYAVWDNTNMFTYSASYKIENDTNGNWRVKFLTSGTLKFTADPGPIDVFLVGGGGGGYGNGGMGGGGGYTSTVPVPSVQKNFNYTVTVGYGGAGGNIDAGTSGGPSKIEELNISALGGLPGGHNFTPSGGSGGGSSVPGSCAGANAGSDGSNGSGQYGGIGQQRTTREFGEAGATLYSGGGAGGDNGAAGLGGGGEPGVNGGVNTGGGGGGVCWGQAGNGGTGIVIIRNQRPTTPAS